MTELLERPGDLHESTPLLTTAAVAARAATPAALPPAPAPVSPTRPDAAASRGAAYPGEPDSPERHGWWRGMARAAEAAGAAAGMMAALGVVAAAAGYLTFPHAAVFRHLDAKAASWLIPAFALAAIIVAVAAWRAARRLLEGRKWADVLTVLAATVATVVSSTGMWQFFAVYVPTLDTLIRVPIFAFLEIAVLAAGLRARDNMRDFGSSGLDGLAMWALTGTSAFLAALASTTVAEALFRLAPPLVAAWLWERTLVSERRRRPDRRDQQISWRISPARLLVKLGVAEPAGRTLDQVAAQRRITILALAASRVARLEADGAAPWRQRRAGRMLRSALTAAVEHADLSADNALQQRLVAEIAMLASDRELAGLQAATPWSALAAGLQLRDDRRDDDRRDDDRRDDDRQDAGSYAELAAKLARAVRLPEPDGTAQLHEMLAGRDDYVALVTALGRQARAGKAGAKRLMILTALYATGRLDSPADIAVWIASLVPGQPGRVDKAEIRRVRDRLEPYWQNRNYPDRDRAAAA